MSTALKRRGRGGSRLAQAKQQYGFTPLALAIRRAKRSGQTVEEIRKSIGGDYKTVDVQNLLTLSKLPIRVQKAFDCFHISFAHISAIASQSSEKEMLRKIRELSQSRAPADRKKKRTSDDSFERLASFSGYGGMDEESSAAGFYLRLSN